jgi:uncharacterized membrane protein
VADVVFAIFAAIFEIVFVLTGRVMLPIISGGNWQATPLNQKASKTIERQPDGTLVFSESITGFVGVVFWAILVAVVLAIVLSFRADGSVPS